MELLVRNGRILDGNGNPWFRADVGIDGQRIVGVGDLRGAEAELVINANDMVVSPGFIDIHNHSDISLVANGKAESMVRQGVTTVVTCNCGSSPFPLMGEARRQLEKGQAEKFHIGIDWSTQRGYEERLMRQGISINTALYLGHGTLRKAIMGDEDRTPTQGELNEMKGIVKESMEAGCFGLSTGLGYSPGMYAKTDEIVELCRVVAGLGGIYSTHGRPSNTFPQNLMEAIEIGEKANIPVQMAHIGSSTGQRLNWGRARSVTLNIVDAARARGIDFTADIYPYTVSGGSLTMYVPGWAQEGGVDVMMKRLADPNERKRIRPEVEEMVRNRDWSQLLLNNLKSDEYAKFQGKTVGQIADIQVSDPMDVAFDIILREGPSVLFMGLFGLEEDIRTLMGHDTVMIGSDGTASTLNDSLRGEQEHPRSFGTFPRVISKYVSDGTLSLPEAVHKMTGMPAWRLGLSDRGIIRKGAYADVTIFNPFTIKDNYSLTDLKYPEGISHVIVNGKVTVEHGTHTGATAGKILHKGVRYSQ